MMDFHFSADPYGDDIQELRAEDRARRARERTLLAHPDPRDPDYPGDEEEDA